MAGTKVWIVDGKIVPKDKAETPEEAVQIASGLTPTGEQGWQPLTQEQQEEVRKQQRAKTLIPREQSVLGLSSGALSSFLSKSTPEEQAQLTRGTRLQIEVTPTQQPIQQPSWWERRVETPVREKITYPIAEYLGSQGITGEKIGEGVRKRIQTPWAYGMPQPYLTDATVGEYYRKKEPLAYGVSGFVEEEIRQENETITPAQQARIDRRKNKIKGFIFFSTCSNYGIANGLANEETELNPLSIYAKAKVSMPHLP